MRQRYLYVGETERELRERMSEHLRDIRLRKDKPLSFHFRAKNHTHNDVAFAILEKTFWPGNDICRRNSTGAKGENVRATCCNHQIGHNY